MADPAGESAPVDPVGKDHRIHAVSVAAVAQHHVPILFGRSLVKRHIQQLVQFGAGQGVGGVFFLKDRIGRPGQLFLGEKTVEVVSAPGQGQAEQDERPGQGGKMCRPMHAVHDPGFKTGFEWQRVQSLRAKAMVP